MYVLLALLLLGLLAPCAPCDTEPQCMSEVFPPDRCALMRTLNDVKNMIIPVNEEDCCLHHHNETVVRTIHLASATVDYKPMMNLVFRDRKILTSNEISYTTLKSIQRIIACAISNKKIPDFEPQRWRRPAVSCEPDEFAWQASNASLYAIVLFNTGKFEVSSGELLNLLRNKKFTVFLKNLSEEKILLHREFKPLMDPAGHHLYRCVWHLNLQMNRTSEPLRLKGPETVLWSGKKDFVEVMVESIQLYHLGRVYYEIPFAERDGFFTGPAFVAFAKLLCPIYDRRYY